MKFNNNKTILFVDDYESMRITMNLALGNKFNIILAKDGEDGLQKYIDNKDVIDLIITDFEMPKLNGYELTKTIREDLNSNIPIILSSSRDEREIKEKLNIKSLDYFNAISPKPISIDKLVKQINKLVMNN